MCRFAERVLHDRFVYKMLCLWICMVCSNTSQPKFFLGDAGGKDSRRRRRRPMLTTAVLQRQSPSRWHRQWGCHVISEKSTRVGPQLGRRRTESRHVATPSCWEQPRTGGITACLRIYCRFPPPWTRALTHFHDSSTININAVSAEKTHTPSPLLPESHTAQWEPCRLNFHKKIKWPSASLKLSRDLKLKSQCLCLALSEALVWTKVQWSISSKESNKHNVGRKQRGVSIKGSQAQHDWHRSELPT